MDDRRFDALTRVLAAGTTRRRTLAALATAFGMAVRGQGAAASGKKAVGARCVHHKQCASGLCEATTGTCVAQCAVPGEACGTGCNCEPIVGGNACLQFPADLNCAGFVPCTWDDEAKDPADVLSCPGQAGAICSVSGHCRGPEEVCLPLCPPSLTF